MKFEDYRDVVEKAAETFRLDTNLIRAVITVESTWDTWAWKYEPTVSYSVRIRDYANKLGILYATEEKNQKTSWGLMQVMGFLARDLGFTDHLSMLWHPEIGIFYGAKNLQRLSQKYSDETDVIASYNAGSPRKTPGGFYENQGYVNRVSGELSKLRKLI